MKTEDNISEIFMQLFRDISDFEERCLQKSEYADLTVNELHVIGAIGQEEPKASSKVSAKLGITMGSLTKSVDGLERKGYVIRQRCENDKRVVLLRLSDKGKKACDFGTLFHEQLVGAVVQQLDESENRVLKKSLGTLRDYVESESFTGQP